MAQHLRKFSARGSSHLRSSLGGNRAHGIRGAQTVVLPASAGE